MIVTIRFQPPTRKNGSSQATDRRTLHERRLEAVPEPIAQQMADDFLGYRVSGYVQAPEVEQYRSYRYEYAGREVQVALDFGEIRALNISRD